MAVYDKLVRGSEKCKRRPQFASGNIPPDDWRGWIANPFYHLIPERLANPSYILLLDRFGNPSYDERAMFFDRGSYMQ
jgi:hypothetical protein